MNRDYLIMSVAIVGALLLAIWTYPKNGERTIHCGLAEISPDFTQEMRNYCRDYRSVK
jgi:hypothetical protein